MCKSVFEWMMAAGAIGLHQENGPLFVCLVTQGGQQYNGRHLQGLYYHGPLLGARSAYFESKLATGSTHCRLPSPPANTINTLNVSVFGRHYALSV